MTKPYMVGVAQKFIDEGVILHDPVLVDELLSFSESDEGKMEGSGDHDDTAIAFMLSCIGYLKVSKIIGRAEPMKVIDMLDKKQTITDKLAQYRDERGHYLIPFKDIFDEKKRRRSVMM